jgi:NADH dehydrogenase
MRPHVIIVGGGFGGLYAAKALRRVPVRVTLIDRTNHHVFQPLLYQVATAGLSAIDIGEPIRRILRRHRDTTVLLGNVVRIDPAARTVHLGSGAELVYDYLIIAAGVADSYFGHDEWADHAPGLKTIEDALEIRRRILLAFERAELSDDPVERERQLTFAIIGAGPTGAELAGAIAELARHTLVSDFRRINPSEARILLVEGGDRVLPAFDSRLSEKARGQLERLGVEVRTGETVTGVDHNGVDTSLGRIEAATMIWAAGVTGSPLGESLGVPIDAVGRVGVGPDLTIPGHAEVWVIGDMAAFVQDGAQLPGVAQVAMQMGRHAASSIERSLTGLEREPFRYVDKGSMATLGRRSAVAEIKGLRLSGFPAWAAWLLIHIVFLIGFRDRFIVLFEWSKAYLTYGRSARLILFRDGWE